jgi:hypothetical protein
MPEALRLSMHFPSYSANFQGNKVFILMKGSKKFSIKFPQMAGEIFITDLTKISKFMAV